MSLRNRSNAAVRSRMILIPAKSLLQQSEEFRCGAKCEWHLDRNSSNAQLCRLPARQGDVCNKQESCGEMHLPNGTLLRSCRSHPPAARITESPTSWMGQSS